MRKEVIKTDPVELAEMKRAKNRIELLGAHKTAGNRARGYANSRNGKSGRVKTFYFKKSLPSWRMFLEHEISFDEMRELQKAGE